jgi:hypothetical protein
MKRQVVRFPCRTHIGNYTFDAGEHTFIINDRFWLETEDGDELTSLAAFATNMTECGRAEFVDEAIAA